MCEGGEDLQLYVYIIDLFEKLATKNRPQIAPPI
jgi:hypothetical protein